MAEKFIVPQFIDAEDKIWGPVTVRQFVIIIIGGLFIFIAYKLSDFSLFLFQAIITLIFIIVFGFVKINGAPFHIFALNFIETTFKKPKIRVWHKEHMKTKEFKLKKEVKTDEVFVKKSFVPSRKLAELSLIIDTGGAYKGEQQVNQENNVAYSNK